MGAVTFTVVSADFSRAREKMARAAPKAAHAVAIQVAKDTSPFVPFLTGSLDQRTRVEADTITYPGPYARYLYYGKLMVDPNTGSPWARKGVTKVLTNRNLVFNHSGHSQAQDHWFDTSKALNKEKWIRVAGEVVKHEF